MKPALVVDLDKTLLKIDTFRAYIMYVGIEALKVFRLDICLVLALYTILRKARLISHKTLKFHVLRKSQFFMNDSRLDVFVSQISCEVNPKVFDIIEEYKSQGAYSLLSTAAPINYANKIKTMFAFDGICATPMPNKGVLWNENVREKKCNTTLVFLQEKGLELDTFITDHYDDLELLKVKKRRNILVEPSVNTLKKVRECGVAFDTI